MQTVSFTDAYKRLYWPLSGTFPSALSVMKSNKGGLDPKEALQNTDGTWHEIALEPLTNPKVSSIEACTNALDQFDVDWAAYHKHHASAQYIPYGDASRPDVDWECTCEGRYLTECCGQERPLPPAKRSLSVPVVAKGEYVTIRDYVSGKFHLIPYR